MRKTKKIVLPGKCVFARFYCVFYLSRTDSAFNSVQMKQYLPTSILLLAYLPSVLRPKRHRIYVLYNLACQKGKYSSASWRNTWPILYVLPAQSPRHPHHLQCKLGFLHFSSRPHSFCDRVFVWGGKNSVSDVCWFVLPQRESVRKRFFFPGGNCKSTWYCKSIRHSLQLCT